MAFNRKSLAFGFSYTRAARQTRRLLKLFLRASGRQLTNIQMVRAGIIRYGARIYDMRQAGWVVRLVELNRRTGVTTYRLQGRIR